MKKSLVVTSTGEVLGVPLTIHGKDVLKDVFNFISVFNIYVSLIQVLLNNSDAVWSFLFFVINPSLWYTLGKKL